MKATGAVCLHRAGRVCIATARSRAACPRLPGSGRCGMGGTPDREEPERGSGRARLRDLGLGLGYRGFRSWVSARRGVPGGFVVTGNVLAAGRGPRERRGWRGGACGLLPITLLGMFGDRKQDWPRARLQPRSTFGAAALSCFACGRHPWKAPRRFAAGPSRNGLSVFWRDLSEICLRERIVGAGDTFLFK